MYRSFILCSLMLLPLIGTAQYNPETLMHIPGQKDGTDSRQLVSKETTIHHQASNLYFFATHRSGGIDQVIMNGGVISVGPQVISGGGSGLALCDNLNGGSLSPTFYSTDSATNQVMFYDLNGWNYITQTTKYYNPGSNGHELFFQGTLPGSPYIRTIERYDGSSFNTIYSLSGRFICCGDLAVDDDGNIYFPTTFDSTTYISDSFIILSKTGQILKLYPFSMNCVHAYGCFMQDGVYYLGLGATNPINPNTLIPLVFGSNSIAIGSPIPMPSNNYADLASNMAGLPLKSMEIAGNSQVNIFPNPADDHLFVKKTGRKEGNLNILYDLSGREVQAIESEAELMRINTSGLQSGLYLLRSGREGEYIFNKILVEH